MSVWTSDPPSPQEGFPEWWWIQLPQGRKGWNEPAAARIHLDPIEGPLVAWIGSNDNYPEMRINDPEFIGARFAHILYPEED